MTTIDNIMPVVCLSDLNHFLLLAMIVANTFSGFLFLFRPANVFNEWLMFQDDFEMRSQTLVSCRLAGRFVTPVLPM